MAHNGQCLVFIVLGPSGSGKSTLVEKMLEVPGTMFSISRTTRPPRSTETLGKWYDFVTEDEFERMVEQNDFLEHARVFGKHQYGTPRRWLHEAENRGLELVLEIDVQGAAQVKRELPEAIGIFILPPAREELGRRLRARGQDSEEAIQRRIERASQEIQHYREYEFLVVNDDMERAGREVQAIVLAARCLRDRMSPRTQRILESFGGQ